MQTLILKDSWEVLPGTKYSIVFRPDIKFDLGKIKLTFETLPGCKYATVESVQLFQLQTHGAFKNHIDPECRSYVGLSNFMNRIYPNFHSMEIVLCVTFTTDAENGL